MKKEEFIKQLKKAEKNFYDYKGYKKGIDPNEWLYISLSLQEIYCKASNRTKRKTKKEINLLINFINEIKFKHNSIDLLELKNNLYYLKENL